MSDTREMDPELADHLGNYQQDDPRCDWCYRATVHRHVDNVETVQACHLHHTYYLGYLARVRELDRREGVVRHPVSSGNQRPTLDEMPMGGCSTARAHYAHLAAGDPKCENQR